MLWLLTWWLATKGVAVDGFDLPVLFLTELLFLILVAAVSDLFTAQSAQSPAKSQPLAIETLLVAVGALPPLAQNFVSNALALYWKVSTPGPHDFTIAFDEVPNLFAALLWGALDVRNWWAYTAAVLVVLGVAVVASVHAARQAAAASSPLNARSTAAIYGLSVGLFSLNALFYSPHMTQVAEREFAKLDLSSLALFLIPQLGLIAVVVFVVGNFRRTISTVTAWGQRLALWLIWGSVFAAAVNLAIWTVSALWAALESIPDLNVPTTGSGGAVSKAIHVDWRLAVTLLGLAIVTCCWPYMIAAARKASLPRRLLQFWQWLQGVARGLLSPVRRWLQGGWRFVRPIQFSVPSVVLRDLGIGAAIALAAWGLWQNPIAPRVDENIVVIDEPDSNLAESATPELRFELLSLACKDVAWRKGSSEAIEALPEGCVSLDKEVSFVVVVGQASFETTGRAREEKRAAERGARLARAFVGNGRRVFVLNNGMRLSPSRSDRSERRPMVLAGTVVKAKGGEAVQLQVQRFLKDRIELAAGSACEMYELEGDGRTFSKPISCGVASR